jgi:hypothetical protein
MRSICDFNLSTPRNRTQSSNECGIVINNTVSGKRVETKTKRRASSFPETLTYPDIASVQGSPLDFPPTPTPPVGVEYPTQTREIILESPELLEAKMQVEFYKELAQTFSKILKSTNLKLIVNLIDQSGKIIVDATSLCILIGLIVNVPAEQIHIEYEATSEGGCTTKVNPIHKIETIKINHTDFKLGYNEKYNILGDTFAVSLKKVFISKVFD